MLQTTKLKIESDGRISLHSLSSVWCCLVLGWRSSKKRNSFIRVSNMERGCGCNSILRCGLRLSYPPRTGERRKPRQSTKKCDNQPLYPHKAAALSRDYIAVGVSILCLSYPPRTGEMRKPRQSKKQCDNQPLYPHKASSSVKRLHCHWCLCFIRVDALHAELLWQETAGLDVYVLLPTPVCRCHHTIYRRFSQKAVGVRSSPLPSLSVVMRDLAVS